MNRGVICLIVGMLCLWPLGISAAQPPPGQTSNKRRRA
jgi:hypothetical protein